MMKKLFLIATFAAFSTGCATSSNDLDNFYEAAEACSDVCQKHPSINSVSSSIGGGFPILFMGKMEASCQCDR